MILAKIFFTKTSLEWKPSKIMKNAYSILVLDFQPESIFRWARCRFHNHSTLMYICLQETGEALGYWYKNISLQGTLTRSQCLGRSKRGMGWKEWTVLGQYLVNSLRFVMILKDVYGHMCRFSGILPTMTGYWQDHLTDTLGRGVGIGQYQFHRAK